MARVMTARQVASLAAGPGIDTGAAARGPGTRGCIGPASPGPPSASCDGALIPCEPSVRGDQARFFPYRGEGVGQQAAARPKP